MQVSEGRTGGAGLALDRPPQSNSPEAPRQASRLQACQGLLLLEGEEPPAVPPGAQDDRAAGGRVGAKTRK